MKYCRSCGAVIKDQDLFCSQCGKSAHSISPCRDLIPAAEGEPRDRFWCELAYMGFFFWLPLAFCKTGKYRTRSANQGLWALLLATASCTGIRLAGAVNALFADSLFGILSGGFYSLLFIIFLSFMLYLVWKCLYNVLQIHKGGDIAPILFFDEAAIIR